jgi:hypothetical protein
MAFGIDVAVLTEARIKQGFHCAGNIDIPLDKVRESRLF